jgi:hypothetical protein
MPDWWPQRRFIRQSIALPLLHRPKDATLARVGAGWTCDLSPAGACIEVAERFAPQLSLCMRLQTARGPIEGVARVIWAADPPPREGGICHGIAFTDLVPDQLHVLRELLLSLKPWWHAGGRLPVNLPVTCRLQRPPRIPLKGKTGNLSRRGVLLHLPRALPPLTNLEITLRRTTETLALMGLVVWVEQREMRRPGGLIAHGLRFSSLDWNTSLALARLLAEPEEHPHRSS